MRAHESPPQVTRAPPAEEGFDAFYRSQYGRAVQLAWLLTHSRTASEDIAQEAFISVHARFAALDSPSAYLRAALVNRSRTWFRGQQRRRDVQDRVDAEEQRRADPAEEYLLDAIAGLGYRQRVVIVARYWGEWTELEIAQALGCRPGTVKSLASRALSRLREEVPR